MSPYTESSLASLALDVKQAAKVICLGDIAAARMLLKWALVRLEEIEAMENEAEVESRQLRLVKG